MQATHSSSFDSRLYMPYLPKITNTFHYFLCRLCFSFRKFCYFCINFFSIEIVIHNGGNIIRAIASSVVFLFSCSAFGANVEVEDSVVTTGSDKHKTEKDEHILIKTTRQIGKGTSAIAEAGYIFQWNMKASVGITL